MENSFKYIMKLLSTSFDCLIFGVDISTVYFSSNDYLACSTQSVVCPNTVNSFVRLVLLFVCFWR